MLCKNCDYTTGTATKLDDFDPESENWDNNPIAPTARAVLYRAREKAKEDVSKRGDWSSKARYQILKHFFVKFPDQLNKMVARATGDSGGVSYEEEGYADETDMVASYLNNLIDYAFLGQ